MKRCGAGFWVCQTYWDLLINRTGYLVDGVKTCLHIIGKIGDDFWYGNNNSQRKNQQTKER